MSTKKKKIDILVVLMQTGKQGMKYIKMKLQQNTELQQIVDYLKLHNKLPFRNCIFTTKPAQKGQFTMQKTIKEISTLCKIKEGAAVLLCYQSKFKNMCQDSFIKAQNSLISSQKSDKSSPKKQHESNQKGQENGCIAF